LQTAYVRQSRPETGLRALNATAPGKMPLRVLRDPFYGTIKVGGVPMLLQTYRLEKTVPGNKTITLRGLPFAAGEQVEILIVRRPPRAPEERYSLRGQPVQYDQPFEGVAEADS